MSDARISTCEVQDKLDALKTTKVILAPNARTVKLNAFVQVK